MKWHDCKSCGEEFRVITDSVVHIEYCPFCGADIVDEEEEDYDDEEDEDYDY